MELYYVMSIVNRNMSDTLIKIHKELNLSLVLVRLGYGSATSEHLSLYDLEPSEKAIITTVATADSMKQLIRAAKRQMFIDIPGNGIMMAMPLKSVCGGNNLAYLTEGQTVGGSKHDMTNFENELIIVVLKEGFSDQVMDAARSAGAAGGTMLHAKGTGKQKNESFYGISLAEEKDMLYILASSAKKGEIMKKINAECGPQTPIGAICFSLPVSEAAGIRKLDEE